MTPHPASKLGLQALAAWLILNAAAALWAFAGLAEQKANAVRKAEATTQNLAGVLDQSITGSIEKIDLAVQGVVDELQRQLQETGRLDGPQVTRLLAIYRQRLNGLITIRVTNAEGQVVLGPDVQPDQLQSWADRPFFAPLRDQAASGLTITKPLTGRVSGVEVISFVRRISLPEGRFGGVVSAAVPLAHFNQLLAGLNLGRGGVAALRDADFGLIARQPPSPVAVAGTVGSQVVPPELARAKALGQTQGTYSTRQTADGIERTVTFKHLKEGPFTLVVGLAADDYLVEWRAERIITLLQLGGFAWLTSLLGWLLWRAVRRQHHEAERSRALLRGASDGIHIVGLDGRVIEASDAFARMVGCRVDEVIGQPLQRWQADAGQPGPLADRDGTTGAQQVETRLRHRGGHLLDVEISSHPLVLDGKPVLFASARDIAERKAAELAVLRLNAELEQRVQQRTAELEVANAGLAQARDLAEAASRAKSTFLATMSHELRTPMNAIMGMTALALGRASDPKQIGQLAKVDGAAKHLLASITDILDIARIEANKLRLQEADFSLQQTLHSVDTLTRAQADAKGIELLIDLAPALRAQQLHGDGQRLLQILLNLASNAVKFTEAGRVTLSASLQADQGEQRSHLALRFAVQDSGAGISPADQVRIFHAFEQADGSYSRKHGGTGLGLAISKQLVELMGGTIGVTSQLGLGSTFWFTVSLRQAAAVAAPAVALTDTTAQQLQQRHAGALVLVAEDDVVNQEVTQWLLQEADVVVHIAADGAQAVDMARRVNYDLVLMDLQMPVMDGLTAARQIRSGANNPGVPIIAMTANVFPEDEMRCRAAGMDDFLARPVAPEVLFATVLKWLDRSAD